MKMKVKVSHSQEARKSLFDLKIHYKVPKVVDIKMTTNANSTIAPDFEEGDTGTIYLPPYDPTVPVDRSNQIGQLAAICILNGLTRKYSSCVFISPALVFPVFSRLLNCADNDWLVIIIVARTWYRGKKLKRFRADDKWIIAAGVSFSFRLPYYAFIWPSHLQKCNNDLIQSWQLGTFSFPPLYLPDWHEHVRQWASFHKY